MGRKGRRRRGGRHGREGVLCAVGPQHQPAPVLRNGELVGIITRTDVVRAIAAGSLNTDLTPTSDAQTAPA
ncbi:MAG: CBS domain-containing protein [Chloroflexia bacterium]